MKDFNCVDVLISVPLDKVFTYKSNFKIKIGSVVKIPFGNNNEIVKGIIISKPYIKKINFQIKEIISVENYESILSDTQLKLLKWSSTYYLVKIKKIFNSVFSKNILDINLGEKYHQNKNRKSNNYKTNLIVDHSKNIIINIINEIKSNRDNNQILILCPNSYKTQSTYNILSKENKDTYIYDSKTTSSDKIKIWKDVLMNKKVIILGSKSAVFLQYNSLKKTVKEVS